MRELTVRIKFTKHSLGAVKVSQSGRFVFARNPNSGNVIFLATWHQANLKFAAQVFGQHQEEVKKILWDINVDGVVQPNSWFRRYFTVTGTGKQRFVLHETFVPGQIVGLNCVVPSSIPDENFWGLMRLVGQYRGLSPAKPKEFGHFELVSIRHRRGSVQQDADVTAVEN